MRKKTIVWTYLLLLSLGTILNLYIPKNEVAAKDAVVIPGQAIRLRILANSDFDKDQALKRQVRDAVNAKISVWVKDLTSIKEARKVIKSKLPEIQATAEEVVKEEGSKQTVNVKFGKVQFPTKLYGQFLYPAGEYEAILITLGKGEGANWWCVLFPPLCFLDFSNGIAVSKGFDEKAEAASNEKDDEVKANLSTEEKSKTEIQPQTDVHPRSEVEVEKQNAKTVRSKTSKAASVEKAVSKTTKTTVAVVNHAEKEKLLEDTQAETASVLPVKEEKPKKEAPVYTAQDEEPVKVKFFVVELWDKIF